MATTFIHKSNGTYAAIEDMTHEQITAALAELDPPLSCEFITEEAYDDATDRGKHYIHRSDGTYGYFEGMSRNTISAMLADQSLSCEFIEEEEYREAIAE